MFKSRTNNILIQIQQCHFLQSKCHKGGKASYTFFSVYFSQPAVFLLFQHLQKFSWICPFWTDGIGVEKQALHPAVLFVKTLSVCLVEKDAQCPGHGQQLQQPAGTTGLPPAPCSMALKGKAAALELKLLLFSCMQ